MASPLFTFLGASLRLRRNARLTRAQLEAQRMQRFRRLIAHAQLHSPYYAEVMRERDLRADTCRPEDFPVLTKRILSERFDQIVTNPRITRAGISAFLETSRDPAERFLSEFVVLHTSGSSGEVGYFVFSFHDWARGLASLGRIYPPQFRKQRVAFFGATDGHYGSVSWAVSGRRSVWRHFYEIETFDINAPFAGTLQRLQTFQPQVLTGYATGNKMLAEAQQDGRLNIRPRRVQCGGEPLSPGDQTRIETVFGCPCLNIYGTTETMMMGLARSGDPGMTLFDDDLIVEPADDHLLVSNLFNYTLPLVRYRISDTLRLRDAASPYGPYPVIEPVVGRNEWVPVFRNTRGESDFISPMLINEIFVPGVWRFQLRWIDETAFRFAICLESGLDADGRATAVQRVEARLHEILAQKELHNVHFGVDTVEDIPIDPVTRKFKLVLPTSTPSPPG
jgi:phenylacetate-CoA ligase